MYRYSGIYRIRARRPRDAQDRTRLVTHSLTYSVRQNGFRLGVHPEAQFPVGLRYLGWEVVFCRLEQKKGGEALATRSKDIEMLMFALGIDVESLALTRKPKKKIVYEDSEIHLFHQRKHLDGSVAWLFLEARHCFAAANGWTPGRI